MKNYEITKKLFKKAITRPESPDLVFDSSDSGIRKPPSFPSGVETVFAKRHTSHHHPPEEFRADVSKLPGPDPFYEKAVRESTKPDFERGKMEEEFSEPLEESMWTHTSIESAKDQSKGASFTEETENYSRAIPQIFIQDYGDSIPKRTRRLSSVQSRVSTASTRRASTPPRDSIASTKRVCSKHDRGSTASRKSSIKQPTEHISGTYYTDMFNESIGDMRKSSVYTKRREKLKQSGIYPEDGIQGSRRSSIRSKGRGSSIRSGDTADSKISSIHPEDITDRKSSKHPRDITDSRRSSVHQEDIADSLRSHAIYSGDIADTRRPSSAHQVDVADTLKFGSVDSGDIEETMFSIIPSEDGRTDAKRISSIHPDASFRTRRTFISPKEVSDETFLQDEKEHKTYLQETDSLSFDSLSDPNNECSYPNELSEDKSKILTIPEIKIFATEEEGLKPILRKDSSRKKYRRRILSIPDRKRENSTAYSINKILDREDDRIITLKDMFKKEKAILLRKLQEKDNLLKLLQQRVRDIETKNTHLQKALNKEKEECEKFQNYENMFQKVTKEKNAMEGIIYSKDREMKTLEKLLQEADNETEKLTEILKRENLLVGSLRIKCDGYKAQVEGIKEELKIKDKKSQKKIQEMHGKINKLNSSLKNQTSKMNSLQKKIDVYVDDNLFLNESFKEKEVELKSVQAKFVEYDEENKYLQKMLKKEMVKTENLMRTVTEAEKMPVSAREMEIQRMAESEKVQLKKTIDQKDDLMNLLKSEIKNFKMQNHSLKEEMSGLMMAFETIKKEKTALEEELDKMVAEQYGKEYRSERAARELETDNYLLHDMVKPSESDFSDKKSILLSKEKPLDHEDSGFDESIRDDYYHPQSEDTKYDTENLDVLTDLLKNHNLTFIDPQIKELVKNADWQKLIGLGKVSRRTDSLVDEKFQEKDTVVRQEDALQHLESADLLKKRAQDLQKSNMWPSEEFKRREIQPSEEFGRRGIQTTEDTWKMIERATEDSGRSNIQFSKESQKIDISKEDLKKKDEELWRKYSLPTKDFAIREKSQKNAIIELQGKETVKSEESWKRDAIESDDYKSRQIQPSEGLWRRDVLPSQDLHRKDILERDEMRKDILTNQGVVISEDGAISWRDFPETRDHTDHDKMYKSQVEWGKAPFPNHLKKTDKQSIAPTLYLDYTDQHITTRDIIVSEKNSADKSKSYRIQHAFLGPQSNETSFFDAGEQEVPTQYESVSAPEVIQKVSELLRNIKAELSNLPDTSDAATDSTKDMLNESGLCVKRLNNIMRQFQTEMEGETKSNMQKFHDLQNEKEYFPTQRKFSEQPEENPHNVKAKTTGQESLSSR